MFSNNQDIDMLAKTYYGLESVLAKELKDIGAKNIKKLNRAVSFSGSIELMYKANIWLRTASKVIVTIDSFNVSDTDYLYFRCLKIKWEKIFNVNQTFSISPTIYSSKFTHSQFAALRVKDSIVDRFRNKTGERPNVDKENPDIFIDLHIAESRCTISLNTSGMPLFKRGYRVQAGEAPLKEDLAAGLILLSSWDKKSDFVDPFCGSGTLLIEAAMIACNIAPNLHRTEFAFERLSDFKKGIFHRVLEQAKTSEIKYDGKIVGVDNDSQVLVKARRNLNKAALPFRIQLHDNDFAYFSPTKSRGCIVTNPPYGERMGDRINELYARIGDTLKQKYNGYDAFIISSNFAALKKIGLKASSKTKIFNGKIECQFVKYEMYKGTRD